MVAVAVKEVSTGWVLVGGLMGARVGAPWGGTIGGEGVV